MDKKIIDEIVSREMYIDKKIDNILFTKEMNLSKKLSWIKKMKLFLLVLGIIIFAIGFYNMFINQESTQFFLYGLILIIFYQILNCALILVEEKSFLSKLKNKLYEIQD